jgi:hypothetical protein
MIYSSYTFQDCYSAISPLHAYFLPSHGNGEALVLGKLPYNVNCPWNFATYPSLLKALMFAKQEGPS